MVTEEATPIESMLGSVETYFQCCGVYPVHRIESMLGSVETEWGGYSPALEHQLRAR